MNEVRVLLVDDDFEKARSISEVLSTCTRATYSLDHESNAASARQAMRARRYDLLLVDVNLPDSVASKANPNAGFQLLELIRHDAKVITPGEVIFVTAREDLVAEARLSAAERGATLCQIAENDDLWKKVISGKVDYIWDRSRRVDRPSVDIALIAALRSPELDAILALPYSWTDKRFAGDPTTYHFGTATIAGAEINLVAAAASRKGMPSSASLAAKMALTFQPRLLVMLGICGGIAGKVNLGDVVVADPTWDWGSGKHAQNGQGSPVFKAAPYQSALPPSLAALVAEAAHDDAILSDIRAGWTGSTPGGKFGVHLGPMASGASVLAQDGAVDVIIEGNREVLAVEMEGYAVMAAGEACNATSLVMKSVCDFADPSKNDDWQAYAAYTSAAFFDRLLNRFGTELIGR